jgi:ElaB/YqjD/DUF883 family membrane-anchored ribosome-binding protein
MEELPAPRTEAADTGAAPPLKQQAADLGRKATEGARQVAAQAQTTARTRLERGKQDAATMLTSVASTLLESGGQLRDRQQDFAGEYIERTAQQIERAAQFVQNTDVREIVDQVEDFARRKPAVFIGTAFAAGLLAARFLKSSRNARPADHRDAFSQPYTDREVRSNIAREPGPASSSSEDQWPGSGP